jgi:spermidine synthase
MRRPAPRFAVILALFFLSGSAGLLYEVAWFRRLQLVFGVSAFAVGAAVAAFMFGLAAGSRWAGETHVIKNRPLRAYAVIEGAIAIYAVLFPLLIGLVESLYSQVFGVLGGSYPWDHLAGSLPEPAGGVGRAYPLSQNDRAPGDSQDCRRRR